jgi:hypothetical protein
MNTMTSGMRNGANSGLGM